MARMNGTGPEGRGATSGRGLGNCATLTDKEKSEKLGKGMGKRRKAANDGYGLGKRLKSGLENINH